MVFSYLVSCWFHICLFEIVNFEGICLLRSCVPRSPADCSHWPAPHLLELASAREPMGDVVFSYPVSCWFHICGFEICSLRSCVPRSPRATGSCVLRVRPYSTCCGGRAIVFELTGACIVVAVAARPYSS